MTYTCRKGFNYPNQSSLLEAPSEAPTQDEVDNQELYPEHQANCQPNIFKMKEDEVSLGVMESISKINNNKIDVPRWIHEVV